MSQYWIRNRGRTTGPFTADKLHSLARRGRFNKHFQVSRDRKNWQRATDFPELFAPVHDVVATPQYGDPAGYADDDFVEPPRSEKPSNRARRDRDEEDWDDDEEIHVPKKKKKKRSISGDDWDDDDEDFDDDEWDDDDEYEGGGPGEWLNDHVFEILVVVALGLIGSFAWYILNRENFSVDEADLAIVVGFRDEISAANSSGQAGTPAWEDLRARAEAGLAEMKSRLEETASAQDNIKQELLFAVRDDIPMAMKELPSGEEKSFRRIDIRIQKIREMLAAKTRKYTGDKTISPNVPGADPDAIERLRAAAGMGSEPANPANSDPNQTPPNNAPPNQNTQAGNPAGGNIPNQPPQQGTQTPPIPPDKALGEGGGRGMRPAGGVGPTSAGSRNSGSGGSAPPGQGQSENGRFNSPNNSSQR